MFSFLVSLMQEKVDEWWITSWFWPYCSPWGRATLHTHSKVNVWMFDFFIWKQSTATEAFNLLICISVIKQHVTHLIELFFLVRRWSNLHYYLLWPLYAKLPVEWATCNGVKPKYIYLFAPPLCPMFLLFLPLSNTLMTFMVFLPLSFLFLSHVWKL